VVEASLSSVPSVTQRAIGEFFREAGVLVGVFGSLDPMLRGGHLGFGWVARVGAVTISLFLVGLYFTIKADAT
jgi:hypothetical protein